MTGARISRTRAARTARSLHCFRQPSHVVIHGKPVGLRQGAERRPRRSALTLLDSTELPLSESLNHRLRQPRILAELPDRSPVPLVISFGPLLRLPKLFRIDSLEELVPSQVDVEVRPVDERAIRVNQEV